jgi:hypothetical protein
MKAGYYIVSKKTSGWDIVDTPFEYEREAIECARVHQIPDNVCVVKITPIAKFVTTVETRRLS